MKDLFPFDGKLLKEMKTNLDAPPARLHLPPAPRWGRRRSALARPTREGPGGRRASVSDMRMASGVSLGLVGDSLADDVRRHRVHGAVHLIGGGGVRLELI